MRKIRHGNHVKQLTIWLLFLFLGIGCPEAWGQNETLTPGATISGSFWGEKILPTGTYTLDNADGESSGQLTIEGTVTLLLKGTNVINASNYNPAIQVSEKNSLIITNADSNGGILKATGKNTGSSSPGRANPSIGGKSSQMGTEVNMGTVTIKGSVYVEATGSYRNENLCVPAIGGGCYTAGFDIIKGKHGSLILEDGASVNLSAERSTGSPVTVKNFALFGCNNNSYHKKESGISNYIRTESTFGYTASGWSDFVINGNKAKIYVFTIDPDKLIPLYKTQNNDYGTIDNIPFPMDQTDTYLGEIRCHNDYYPSVQGTFTQGCTFNINNYPYEGTLKAGAKINLGSYVETVNTSTNGLTLDASAYPLQLATLTFKNTAILKIRGKVWLDPNASESQKSILPPGVARDESNTPIYHCHTTIPIGTISSINYGGTETQNFYQDGTNLYLWLPAGNQQVRITDSKNAVYTVNTEIKTKHYQQLTVYPTVFNIAHSSVTLSTNTSGSQNVTYNSNTYASPFGTPITITGTSTSGNNVIINNGATGNVILKDLNISGNTLPLNVTGNTTANITVAGTNNLTSTGNHALQVESGSTISLTGTVGNTLTLSATNTSTYKDVKTSGTLNLSGAFTLVAKNGTFPPTANITSGTPVVKLADTQYFRAILPNATIGTLSDMEYAGGTQVNEHLFTTTTISNNYHLWMPATSKDIVFKGSKPTAATLYTIPAATFTAHNVTLTALPVVASIGSAIYGSLADAFAAATNGQTVKMETTHTLPANTTATLSKLQAGQVATLSLGGYTLTTGQNTLLSSGKGVLKLEGTGTLSGAYALEGCLYSTLGSGQLGTPTLGGKPVYRVSVSGLPTNMGTPMVAYYRTQEPNTAYKAYSASPGSATLWLPQGQQEATIADILATVNEPVATTSVDVQMNHDNNTATASARLDIAYGDIKVTPGTVTTTISYGSKPYAATPAAGISATNRLSILGTATPDNGKNFQILVNNGGSGTAYLNLRNVNIRPSGQKAAVLVNAATDIALEGDNQLRGGGSASGTEPAIKIASGSVRLSDPSTDSKGRLYAYGGSYGNLSSPAILSEGSGNLTIAGGTLVARLTYTKAGSSTNQPYNTLPEAFAAASKAYAAGGAQDITVHLLTGVSVSGTLTVSGQFTLNLDGKNLTSASGGLIQAQNGARLTVSDGTAGMKGTMQVNLRMLGTGQVFIPSYIKLSGNVYKGDTGSPFYWRTTLNMNYQPVSVTQVSFEGVTYPVIDREVCLWLPADNDPAKVYTFTLGGKTMTVTGYQISANKHDNDMTLGGSNNEARIGTQEHATLKAALDAAVSGNTIELLKTVSLADYTLNGKSLILELGKYELNGSAAASALTLGSGTALTVKSQGGNGKLKMDIKLNGGNLYVGQDVAGDGIGTVRSAGGTPYHRLLITNLPLNVPPGTHNFSYADLDNNNAETGTPQKGTFMVRENIGCLWLEEAIARRLRITVGTGTYDTENVTVNANHYNTETYGVKDVAQIRNGKKYADLKEAFAAAAGRTIVLLKNAALKENVTISGSVVLEMGEYTITSQDVSTLKAAITLPKGANLQITGNGSINSDFSLAAAPENGTYGNGNLQVDKGVNLTGNIRLDGGLRYRVSIDGLPISKNIRYTYETQTGAVRSSASGTLCLWMNVSNKPANFYADDTDGKSYLATQVVITATHSNPISLTKVDAVAEVNGQAFDSLKDAFAGAANGNTIKLRKDADNLSGTLALNGDITVTLDMEGNTINAANLTLDAKKGQMLVQDGKLTGTLILSGNVFIDGDVSMTNATVAQAKKTVWRTFITLPDATASFSYKLGDETPVTCTNIHTNADGKPVACLWLPSSNVARTLTVSAAGNEYALSNVVIASTHGNELDITSGNNPVAKDGNNKQFASLASALADATGTITLMRDLTLGTIQSITANRTIDLANFRITSTNGGFDINAGTTLTLLRGQVLGTLSLNGDGGVSALGDVKIAGIVLDKNHEEIYRVLVKVKDNTQCLWVTTSKVEEDRTIQTNHEVTIPAGLSNHNTTLTAYEVKTLDNSGSWQAAYANTRLKLGANAVLTLPEETKATLNRLILRDGAKVTGNGQVIATEGIRYVRAITAGKWESIALPFTASRITMATDAGATTILSPAYGNGNAGNFWLRMVSTNGALINVNSPEMTANQFYLIAVPNDLGGKELTFVSGANQLLRRDKVLAVKPASGFAAYANGTLDEIQVSQPCYVLKADGKSFTRVNTATISPFRGYLLADAATTAVTPELRMAGIPTATETIVPGEPLRVSTRRGALTVSTGRSVTVRIYTMNGFPVESFKLDYGERTVFLPTGIYIVNRQKVWVD
jgi:hypothetical protein